MRVIHLSVADGQGGAARAAYRLHDGLRRIGVDSGMLVTARTTRDPAVQGVTASRQLKDRLFRRFRRFFNCQSRHVWPLGSQSLEIFSTGRSCWGRELLQQANDADIVNLHWVAGMFEYDQFLSNHQRFVWTLHDMHPFTGGCHFDGGCGRFSNTCGECPQLASKKKNDISFQMWSRRHKAVSQLPAHRLTIVSPSRWLADQCRASSLLGRFRIETIPYGVDTEIFQPRDRGAIRDVLGIPQNARVVLFVADGLGNRRKGLDLLLQSLQQLAGTPDLWLLSMGGGDEPPNLPFYYKHAGRTHDDRMLSFVYSAADLFVIPSRQDNLPNTVMEAMACGVPVVGFDVGGVPDMVQEGKTGRLVPFGDVTQMATAIRMLLLENHLREEMSRTSRRLAVAEYTLEQQASRYAELYRQLIDDGTVNPESSTSITSTYT